VSVEDLNAQAWSVYGQRQLARSYMPPLPQQMNWAPWEGVGPGAEVLGDIAGRRVLDIGSGPGHHAVHLAQEHGAHVTGVERSPTQYERAASTHADVQRVEFVQGDVVDHLAGVDPFDAAYAIGTLAFIDPYRVLPALREGLRPGAPLILSLLHTDLHGRGPSTAVEPREQMIQLRDHPPVPTQMWVLVPQLWQDLLTEHGFGVEAIDLLHHPDDSVPVVQQLIRARRLPDQPARRSSRPRTKRPPSPHAAIGIGAIVLSDRGVLLGRHHRGTLELPGGTVEPGESLEQTVIRELAEETGLHARIEDVTLLGTLVDHVDDIVRLTVGALVKPGRAVGGVGGDIAIQDDDVIGRLEVLDLLPGAGAVERTLLRSVDCHQS
jgi:ADP-ribose pyrophosphatase YjhB (NUDIX family)/SAM-dependent methyltransferase